MSDWLLNLPVAWMGVIILATIYLGTAAGNAGAGVGNRQAVEPGCGRSTDSTAQ